MDFDDISLG